MIRRRISKVFSTVFLVALALMVLWPLWFMLTGALTSTAELNVHIGQVFNPVKDGGYASWPLLPRYPTVQPLVQLLMDTPEFFIMFWNTCKLVFPQLLGQVLVGAPAAWAFSKFKFPCRKLLFSLYIILMLMPFQVTMVTSYLVNSQLGIINTIWAIVLPGVFSTFPVFIMARGFDMVPGVLLESAALDGANAVQTFFRIGVALGKPGILAALVLSFLEAWNAIEQPLVFLKDQTLWPLSLLLSDIATQNLGLAMGASLVMLLPAVLIFSFGQKYLELGIQASGIKE